MPRSAHATEGWEAELDVNQTLSHLSSKQPKAALSCFTASALEKHRYTALEGHWLLLRGGCWRSCYILFPVTLLVGGCKASVPQLCFAFSSCTSTDLKPLCLTVLPALWHEGCSGEHLSLSQLDWWAERWHISCFLWEEMPYWNYIKLSGLTVCLYAFQVEWIKWK